MTPEELNRTIEFLVKHQAQFSVDLQRDHDMLNQGFKEMHTGFAEMRTEMRTGFAEMRTEMRLGFAEMRKESAKMRKEFARVHSDIDALQKTTKRIAGLQMEMALNNRWIAGLIDVESRRLDEYEKWQQEFQREALRRLDRILEKLTGNNQKPN